MYVGGSRSYLHLAQSIVSMYVCMKSVPLTARSIACVCCRSPPEIAGSTPDRGGAGVSLSVSGECCVLSGRGLCVRLSTLPEESYRVWCIVVCDL
jgi:hypothetical protein